MKRLSPHIVLAILAFLPFSLVAQNSLSQLDAEFVIKLAEDKVKSLGGYMELIGNPDLDPTEKNLVIHKAIRENIASRNVVFTNDLDPTQTTPKELKINSYLKNISLFYPEKEGVEIQLSNIKSDKNVYKDDIRDVLFVKVVAIRFIRGKYNHKDKLIDTQNKKDLDFYVKVYDQGELIDPAIYSMTFHQNNAHTFKKAPIVTGEKTIISKEEKDDLIAGAQASFQIASEAKFKANIAQREAAIAKREKEQAEARAQIALREKDLALQAQAQAQKEAELAKRQREQLNRLANKNRISLNIGGGAGIFPGAKFQNSDEVVLSTYLGQASLNYRLTSARKLKKADGGTSLVILGRYGINDPRTVRGLVNDSSTSRPVNESAKGRFWELEGGFILWQTLGFTGGIGSVQYEIIPDIGDEGSTLRKKSYFPLTVSFNSPSLKNTLRLGLSATAVFMELPSSLDLVNTFHTRFNAFLALQLQ